MNIIMNLLCFGIHRSWGIGQGGKFLYLLIICERSFIYTILPQLIWKKNVPLFFCVFVKLYYISYIFVKNVNQIFSRSIKRGTQRTPQNYHKGHMNWKPYFSYLRLIMIGITFKMHFAWLEPMMCYNSDIMDKIHFSQK
jgi:hypothetical protein